MVYFPLELELLSVADRFEYSPATSRQAMGKKRVSYFYDGETRCEVMGEKLCNTRIP